jgi:hypothetical protein
MYFVLLKENMGLINWESPQRGKWTYRISKSSFRISKSSFLFSLRNKDSLAPFIANIKQGQEQDAIFCHG